MAKGRQNSNGVRQATTTANSNNYHDDSPLKLFGEAKEKINGLFEKLEISVNKVSQFYSDNLDSEVAKNVNTERLRQLNRSIETIRSVLSRNLMKVAFFGRTSNGKSTVINAILHAEVLPTGYGHTTSCFLQIEGEQGNEPFLEIQKKGQSDEKRPIQAAQMANALKADSLEHSTLVKIHWPINKCPLLKYDVVLVDSPGIDVEEDLDDWIDEHCRDADVFVLVSNAESTLNIAEKHFFHKVSEKLSKPNIFILNNRWDSIADDPDSMEMVKRQHIERSVHFLSDELKISTQEEARQRTFFVSARETFRERTKSSSPGQSPSTKKEGYNDRAREFENFERCFEESLSKSAVRTKFKAHTDKGKETISELQDILNATQLLVKQVYNKKADEANKNIERSKIINNLFYAREQTLFKAILQIKRGIQIITDSDFDTEVRRLSRIVDDFEEEFSPNPDKLRIYKEQLYQHVEKCLSENLKTRVNGVVTKQVTPFTKDMCDIGKALSEERSKRVDHIVGSQTYVQDDLFDLKIYKQFYTEFQEDLEFRFSLGLVSIIRKFQSKFSVGSKPIPKMNGSLDQSHLHSTMSANTDFLAILERFMLNPPQSPTTVGSLAVGGLLVRTVGWKVIIVTTVVYGALYAYEYLTWTNSAKESTFKAQYVRYARKGLQDCVPIISQHISNSVEQKLTTTFKKVKEEVDTEDVEIKNRIRLLSNSLSKLEKCASFSLQLLDENNLLMNELVNFAASFLV